MCTLERTDRAASLDACKQAIAELLAPDSETHPVEHLAHVAVLADALCRALIEAVAEELWEATTSTAPTIVPGPRGEQ